MAGFGRIIAELKTQERKLAARLEGIRAAIASLEFGRFGAPKAAIIETSNAGGKPGITRRRKLSAKARKAISDAQKRRWAKVRAAKKAS